MGGEHRLEDSGMYISKIIPGSGFCRDLRFSRRFPERVRLYLFLSICGREALIIKIL